MNPLNYATLEACRRLQAAGIVLEFEYCWYPDANSKTGWSLNRCFGKLPSPDCVPAYQMAEVWRELPDGTDLTKDTKFTYGLVCMGKMRGGDCDTKNENPTDALIDLLIFVRANPGQSYGERIKGGREIPEDILNGID